MCRTSYSMWNIVALGYAVICHWVTSTCLKAQCKCVCCSQPRSVLLAIGFVCVPACLPQLPTTEKEDENAEAGGDGGEEEEEPQREEVTEVSSLDHRPSV